MCGLRMISRVDEREDDVGARATDDLGKTGNATLGCANVLATVSGVVWSMLFIRAADHYRHVATFGYPEISGAWDLWVYLPLGLTVGSLLIALAVNFRF